MAPSVYLYSNETGARLKNNDISHVSSIFPLWYEYIKQAMLLVCECVLNVCSRLSLVFTIYRRSVYSFISIHWNCCTVYSTCTSLCSKNKYGEKKFSFSDVLHVTVTKQSQVQFINKPVEKAIGETFVNFTLPHWISFVSVARPNIRNATKEGKEESFLYHGNRKVAKVLHTNATTAYQVHLMTFTAKGAP